MLFWILCLCLAALGALPVVGALLRGRRGEAGTPDMGVYRDQLAEVDRDLSRGVLSAEEAERTRAEVARRLLDADRRRAAPAREAGRTLRVATAAAVGIAVLAGGGGLYLAVGAPGYPDLPLQQRLALAEERRAARPSQEEAEAQAAPFRPAPAPPDSDFARLMERLRSAVRERGDDPQGWRLLARNEARLGDYVAARAAQQELVALLGEDATAQDHAFLAELMVLAAGGFVTPEAEAQLDAALARDPREGRALYYKGLTFAQTGRPDVTLRIWRPLLESSPENAPWVAPIREQIGAVAARAGIEYLRPPSPTAPGPSAADMAAAADMAPEEREEMIRGMVGRLSDRLATGGGPAPDWARLITALGVLGETGRARAIYDESRQVFANQPDDLARLDEAARAAGLVD